MSLETEAISALMSQAYSCQNGHLRIASSSWRLANISPVCRRSIGSQDPQEFKLAAAHRAKASVSSKHRKMLRLRAKRLLVSAGSFWQIGRTDGIRFSPILARFPPPWPRQYSPQHSLDIQTVELSGPGRRWHVDPSPLNSTTLGNMILPL